MNNSPETPGGTSLQPLVEDVHAHVGARATDRHDALVRPEHLADPVQADDPGSLGLAVHVDPRGVAAHPVAPRPHHAGPQRLTRGEQQPQSAQQWYAGVLARSGHRVDHAADHGGDEIGHGDFGFVDSAKERGWVATFLGRRDHHLRADRERNQHLPDR